MTTRKGMTRNMHENYGTGKKQDGKKGNGKKGYGGCGIRIFGDVWHPLPPRGGVRVYIKISQPPQNWIPPPLPTDGVKRGAFDRIKNNWFTYFFSCG